VRRLAESGSHIRALIRDPEKKSGIRGVDFAIGDYQDVNAVRHAMKDVSTLLLVSGHDEPGTRARGHTNVIRAAAAAGVKRIVYTSFQGASDTSFFPYSRDHYITEQALVTSGIPFVILRSSLYYDLLLSAIVDGAIKAPAGNGRAALVSWTDVADAAYCALTGRVPSGAILDVTGPENMSLAEFAERVSSITHRAIRYQPEDEGSARKNRAELGLPPWIVDCAIGSYLALAAGELGAVADTVLALTEHPPLTLEDYLRPDPNP
jgi:uncharacterized protein YbjT (DUF2867 family)